MCGEKSHTTPTFLDQLRLLWFSGRGWELLRSLKNGTPGPDGIPYQVYAMFGESIVGIFTDLAEVSITGVAPRALKEGHLYLLPKKGDNLRPITVANASYRFIMTLVRDTMRVKLEATISTCQKAFMRGRRITDHLRSVLESFYDDVENGVNSVFTDRLCQSL